MYPVPKYKKGDVVQFTDRAHHILAYYPPFVVCGLCAKDEYSLMALKDYVFYMLDLHEEVECPRRTRYNIEYIDKYAEFIGTDLESIRVLYG